MKLSACSVLLALATLASGVHGQTMKPGLWEMTTKTSGSPEMDKAMAEAQKQMAAMSPEQRKMMQDMMAKQGVSMATNASGAMSVKVCLTKEMAENHDIAPQQGDCKTTTGARTGNSMKMSFVCTKPPSSGEGEVTFSGPEAYTSRMTVTSTAGGKSEKMTLESQGKWLGAECGAVKPMVRAKK